MKLHVVTGVSKNCNFNSFLASGLGGGKSVAQICFARALRRLVRARARKPSCLARLACRSLALRRLASFLLFR